MSLASRIGNLFSGNGNPRTEKDSGITNLGRGDDGVADEELFSTNTTRRIHEGGARHTDTMAPKNNEEEGRPPYLHVCLRRRKEKMLERAIG